MNGILSSVLLQIAWAVLEPAILTGVAAAVGWATVKWHQWTGYQIEARHREALQSALGNGVRAGLHALRQQRGYALVTSTTTGPLLDYAQAYVEQSVPGAIKHFSLTPERIRELAVPHLPIQSDGIPPFPASRGAAK